MLNAPDPKRPTSPASIPTRADARADDLRIHETSNGMRSFVNTSPSGITTRKAHGRRSFLGGS